MSQLTGTIRLSITVPCDDDDQTDVESIRSAIIAAARGMMRAELTDCWSAAEDVDGVDEFEERDSLERATDHG